MASPAGSRTPCICVSECCPALRQGPHRVVAQYYIHWRALHSTVSGWVPSLRGASDLDVDACVLHSAASPLGLRSRDSGPSPDNAFSPPCAPLFFGMPSPVSSELNFRLRRPVDDFDDDEDLQFSGLTGGRLVHDALLENGVDTVFGYSGGANLPILDQFHDSKIRFVMNRSEQCCGHAAEGYARSSGRTGVILTTSGPGLTNIITPLQDARGDSTPLVALSGQVQRTKNVCTRCQQTAVLVPRKLPRLLR